jgi:uncharacterized protein
MRRRRLVTVRCTLTNQSPSILSLIQFFEEFGFSRIVFGCAYNPVAVSPLDCRESDFENFSQQEEHEIIPWILSELGNGRVPHYFPYAKFIRESITSEKFPARQSLRCGACFGTTTVGADGTLYPCHRFVGMRNFMLGNVSEGINPSKVKAFWTMYYRSLPPSCDECWARGLCHRPCPWEVATSDGRFTPKCAYSCDSVRESFQRSAWMMWKIQSEYPEILQRLTAVSPQTTT